MSDFTGFVGPAYQAASIYQDAQECINWYVEVDPTKDTGARGAMAMYPRPGLLSKLALAVGEVRGMYVQAGGQTMFAVSGSTLYKVSSSFVATSIGTLATSAGQVSMECNGLQLYVVDGSNRYSYNLTSGVFAALTDGGFLGADKVDYVDNFFVYNRPGTNQWGASSPLSDISPALSFSSKDSASDNLVTLIADHRQVYLLGEKTAEVWINVGAFPFPFQRIPGTSIQHGCAAKFSAQRFGESISFLSADGRGQGVVMQLVGFQPKRMSTHAVETDIAGGVISDAIAYTYQYRGHEFYVLTFPTQDKTWVYDLATEMWHKQAYRDSSNVLHRHRGNCSAVFQGLNLVGDWQNGIIYAMSATAYTDNGDPILRLRRTPHLTKDLNQVTYNMLQIQFQPGVGLTTGQGSTPQCMLRWSNDGGATWSNSYQLGIGKIGEYKNRAIKRQMGMARDRVYEVSITDPVNAVIVSAELETSGGSN